MIQFSNVTFGYANRATILNDINLHIRPGEYVAFAGRNGAGKSTIAKLMNGLLLPTAGQVSFKNYVTSNEDELSIIRQRIGMIFQNPENQIVASTVFEDIAFGLQNVCVPTKDIEHHVTEALRQVGMLNYCNFDVHSLSGGQKQRIAIAGVLAMEPEVIVFDESTSMLDPEGKDQIAMLMGKLHKQGITIVTITHDFEEIAASSRVVVLDQGDICYDGSPEALFQGEYWRFPGVTAPFVVEAREALNRKGLHSSSALTLKDLVDDICKLH
ncbi:energy-coupling factor transporter ATPase [Paenibacillus sp. PCH8]|uniref:energy-coupling factor transporter ATPase n=1 Tax=Paenibacillus sp. PCH8 TaxID=2066524 RepID=UPI0015E31A9C|nr:energy-coupling factor transporter ATPase [Paenibacillus sp. PCH8]